MESLFKLPPNISINKILLGAFVLPWYYREQLLRCLAYPLFFLILVTIAALNLEPENSPGFIVWLAMSYALFYAIYAINIHRLVILGPHSIPPRGIKMWTNRELQYIFLFLFLCFLFTMIYLVSQLLYIVFFHPSLNGLSFTPNIIEQGLLSLPGLYLCARFALVLNACAIDKEADFKQSWDVTKGNAWNMVIIMLSFPIIVLLFSQFLPLGEDFYQISWLKALFLLSLINFLLIVQITALSLFYRELNQK